MHDRPRLVPDDFDVPATLEHPRFLLRMLTVNDLVRDYDAVMSSVDHLRATYSREGDGDWPTGLTLEDDLVDLGWLNESSPCACPLPIPCSLPTKADAWAASTSCRRSNAPMTPK